MKYIVIVLIVFVSLVLPVAPCFADLPTIAELQKAGPEIEQAAHRGDTKAEYKLGTMYLTGIYVQLDYNQAAIWYRKAAEKGDPKAQYALSNMYLHEHAPFPLDHSQGEMWLRKAAEHGEPKAEFDLGNMYFHGNGVTRDYVQAAKWYRKAADHGEAFAQSALGNMYLAGDGVPRDYLESYFWFSLSAAYGTTEIGNSIAKSLLNSIEKKLTKEQIAEAQKRASVWKPRP